MKIQAVRGMQDILPAQKKLYRRVEDAARATLDAYGYQEVGLPLLEQTRLFQRSVGENTDIVTKEMYTFEDRNGDSLTLRPEGTASCVRFGEENGLFFNQMQRLWYTGPMFRHERPQKGRYRQFEQIGVECFGMPGPDIDSELLLLCARIWRKLGIEDQLRLELNSLGNSETRDQFTTHLVEYLSRYRNDLDEESQRRLKTNPLRILDSKDDRTRDILKEAPVLSQFLDDESRQHIDLLCAMLDQSGVSYLINPAIVRGLDYYNRTVFEWVTDNLGAQGTVCGGGRYDGLVSQLGGKDTPAVGFAMGLDRLAMMLPSVDEDSAGLDVFFVSQGGAARAAAVGLAEDLRNALNAKSIQVHCGGGKFKAQLKKADSSGASLAIILGEEEVENGTVGVKYLRSRREQITVNQSELAIWCQSHFGKE